VAMSLWKKLRLRFGPTTLQDPDFGLLVYMHIAKNPARSYWEGEWLFPPTHTKVSIALPGAADGPDASGRAFYLSLPERFADVIGRCRPLLDRVFQEWLGRPLSADLWSDVKIVGLDLEAPSQRPFEWSVGFETLGEKWLGVNIPFLGEQPQEPTVDT